MRKYNYSSRVVKRYEKRAVCALILALLEGVVLVWYGYDYISKGSWAREENAWILAVIIAVCVIGSLFYAISSGRTAACLMTNYLEINDDTVSGRVCIGVTNPDNTSYFTVKKDEIISVEAGSYNSNYSLFIYTKAGTYMLCIENADEAMRVINGRP